MLGADYLDDAAREGSSVWLCRTPLNWLRRECRGCCILNSVNLQPAFVGVPDRVPHVICEDLAHGKEFEKWLHQPSPVLPKISVRVSEST